MSDYGLRVRQQHFSVRLPFRKLSLGKKTEVAPAFIFFCRGAAAAPAQIKMTRVGVIVFSVATAQSHFDLMIARKAK